MVSAVLSASGIVEAEEPLCVSFVNTVGNRRSEAASEYLLEPADLALWFTGRKLTASDLDLDQEYRRRALHLRDALCGVFTAIAKGSDPSEDDLDTLNGELAEALAKVELDEHLRWSLATDDPYERPLMLIALSAAGLITSQDAGRIRECADAHCGWIFVDHSKNRSRRWCSMSDCGNVAKARRFQEKRKIARLGG